MRLVSYSTDGASSFGILDEPKTGIINLDRRLDGTNDLSELLALGQLETARAFAGEAADHALADVTIERLLPRPNKIFCIGVNYGGRADEYADKSDAAYPVGVCSVPRIVHRATNNLSSVHRRAHNSTTKARSVAVIGTAGRRIPVDQARDHLAGLSLGNEGTIRDWVRHAKFNVTQGKNWNSTGAMGPHLVTIDEIPAFDELTVTTHVNGEQRQHDSPKTMKYSIDYQIHYLSTFTELQPGDVIFTGTPTGAGARFDPPRWLVPGDVVEVSVPELGTLRNHVVDEFTPEQLDAQPITAPEPQ